MDLFDTEKKAHNDSNFKINYWKLPYQVSETVGMCRTKEQKNAAHDLHLMSLELKMELYIMAKNMICILDELSHLGIYYVIIKMIRGSSVVLFWSTTNTKSVQQNNILSTLF